MNKIAYWHVQHHTRCTSIGVSFSQTAVTIQIDSKITTENQSTLLIKPENAWTVEYQLHKAICREGIALPFTKEFPFKQVQVLFSVIV